MDMENLGRVIVRFHEGSNTVDYAKNLAELLQVPLIAYAPIDRELVDEHARGANVDSSRVRSIMHVRMQEHVGTSRTAGTVFTEIGIPRVTKNDIIVSCVREANFAGTLQLSPAGERGVFRTDERELFVPVGDGPSALYGACVATDLARRLNARICFWHTTWPREGVESTKPIDHALPYVRTTVEHMRAHAESLQVPAQVVVECAPRLVEGLVTTALSRGSGLIVMAEGTHKRFGTYTERVRERNCPIPLLVTGEMS